MMGRLGLGLLSFSVGTTPEELGKRIAVYRAGIAECRQPLAGYVHDRAAAFTLVNCAPTTAESYAIARESFEWYPKRSAELVSSVASWLQQEQQELGSYEYLTGAQQIVEGGLHEKLSFDLLREMNACVCGDPDEVLTRCRAYAATGADMLLCLVNPYRISHEHVMQTIELMGKYVIPELDRDPR